MGWRLSWESLTVCHVLSAGQASQINASDLHLTVEARAKRETPLDHISSPLDFHKLCRKFRRPLSPTKHQAQRPPFSYQKRSKRGKKCANRDNSTQFGPIRGGLTPGSCPSVPAFETGTQKTRQTCISKTHSSNLAAGTILAHRKIA